MPCCPICTTTSLETALAFQEFPLFQHPVKDGHALQNQFYDLTYLYCTDCHHMFQQHSPTEALNYLYENHYYTPPSSSSIGKEFRKDFLDYITRNTPSLTKSARCTILEIASSSGEMLVDMQQQFPGIVVTGIEPHRASVTRAREQGISTHEMFFNSSNASTYLHSQTYDVIFARHLIEHIADFDDFFAALSAIAHANTYVILETPALEYFSQKGLLDPFHIEHLHVFSTQSLQKLAQKHHWHLNHWEITASGNLIASFGQWEVPVSSLPETLPFRYQRITQQIEAWRTAIHRATTATSALYMWGAGAYGRTALRLLNIAPIAILDGNKNKAGLTYVGINIPIHAGVPFITEKIEQNADKDMIIIIASTFWKEITEQLLDLGFRGVTIPLSNISPDSIFS